MTTSFSSVSEIKTELKAWKQRKAHGEDYSAQDIRDMSRLLVCAERAEQALLAALKAASNYAHVLHYGGI